ncbi:hypothetical protein TrLO_g10419 [Triparma laevis f. longispina]|uniref:Uncharacterized protein n=1 Tax=Triparma laevis f. longispina TaxID=1714387 RepID=A0A9W7FLU6_9STRA|nr:hypothetical protein TrLO_g10419 [Triparma laevis f. longispina]
MEMQSNSAAGVGGDRTKTYRAYSIKKELYEFRPLVFSLNTQWGTGKAGLPPHQTKDALMQVNEDGAFNFLTSICYIKGTAAAEIVPQWCFGAAIVIMFSFVCQFVTDGDIPVPIDAQKVHGLIGSITGFLLVFRTNLAYDRYYEGRKLVGNMLNSSREVISACYCFIPREDLDREDTEKMQWIKEHIRRKSLVLWSCIRQSLRESKIGFQPGCGLDDPEFHDNFKKYWHLDPVKPEIAWIISEHEKKELDEINPPLRPTALITEIRCACLQLSQYMINPKGLTVQIFESSKQVMDFYKATSRIVGTPVPFPYTHMLNTLVFFFVYCTPVVYHGDFGSGRGWIATFLVTFCAYGLLEIGVKLENPFGFDDVDHDLEEFGRKMSKESDTIARVTGKEYSGKSALLKEMYTPPAWRRRHMAQLVKISKAAERGDGEFSGFDEGSLGAKKEEKKGPSMARRTLNPLLGASKK